MNFEDRLHRKIGRDAGFTVPEGYFDRVVEEVSAKLPERPARELAKPDLSVWQRIKPYLYLAAMFLGIWCMMKVFHTMSTTPQISLDNPPTEMVALMNDIQDSDAMFPHSALSEYALMEEVLDSYGSMEEFAEDFDYEFDPAYAPGKTMQPEIAQGGSEPSPRASDYNN